MKRLLAIALVLAVAVSCNTLWAKGGKTFEGVITYTINLSGDPSVESSMDMLPPSMLTAVFKTRGQRSMMSIMGQKTFVDAKKGVVTSLIDMSMLGMGTYCMDNPYEGTKTTDADQPQTEFTGETKTICGYKAEKIRLKTPQEGASVELWVTRELSIESGLPTMPGLEGMVPLQFDIQSAAAGMGNITIVLTAKEVKEQKVPNDDLVPPKDCQKITQEELSTLLNQFQNLGGELDE